MDSLKEVAESPEEKVSTEDPSKAIQQLSAKLNKLIKGLKAHRGRFNRIEARLASIEQNGAGMGNNDTALYEAAIGVSSNGIGGGIKPIKKRKPKRKLKTMAESENIKDDSMKDRKHFYKFGSRKLQVLKPSIGCPTKKQAQRPVEGKLELFFAHGYSGNFEDSRQNVCLSDDGSKLLYYIAAIAVVYDYKNNTQQFFTKHNDDLTTLSMLYICVYVQYSDISFSVYLL